MAGWTPDQGRSVLASGEDSDVIIECKGKTWNVHKLIICAVSEHFKLLCQGDFKVSQAAINIDNASMEVVDRIR
jgi:hypothetical protein